MSKKSETVSIRASKRARRKIKLTALRAKPKELDMVEALDALLFKATTK